MSTRPRRKSGTRTQGRRRQEPDRDFWGIEAPVEHEGAAVIHPVDDAAALIASLGPPPLPGHETAAEHYFAVVYDKAATLAIALAAASGLLAPDGADD